jgi:hypothetical protein
MEIEIEGFLLHVTLQGSTDLASHNLICKLSMYWLRGSLRYQWGNGGRTARTSGSGIMDA